uniref:Uncharacterized protein n=1 Tax=Rhodnius prolixus TaxID=13249 RepID=T1HKE0_RHOPR
MFHDGVIYFFSCSESNYGHYFVTCTDILTALFRNSYEVYLKYLRALEDKLYFSCSFEEDITLLNDVMDKTVAIIEIVTGLDIKTAAEQWKSYLKVNSKYAEKIRDRLNLLRPLSVLLCNIQQIINTVTTNKEVLDDKTRTRHLKLGSFILKIFIKLCDLHKGFLDDCLSLILEMLLLLYSCSKNCGNDGLINQELDTYICIGGAALLNQFFEDEHFFRELHNLFIRRMELPVNQFGMHNVVLIAMKKLVVSQSKAIHDLSAKYPFIEMVITLYNDVGLTIGTNFLLEGKDMYMSTVSVLMAFILSTVSASQYIQIEKLLFECFFSFNCHTALLVSDIVCLIARFTNESICLEMVQYLCETLMFWQVHLDTERPEYVIASATLIRLCKFLTEKSCDVISDKYCQNYASHLSYLLARGFCKRKPIPTLAIPDVSSLKEDYNVFVNKLKISGLRKYVEDKCETHKMYKMLIAGFNTTINEKNTSELGCSWNLFLVNQLLRILPIFLPNLSNTQIIQVLSGLHDLLKHGNTSIRVASANCLQKSAENKLPLDFESKDVCTKIADLYATLLADEDPLICQEAVESYSHFVANTDNKGINTLVLNQDNDVQEFLTLFQQKKITIKPKQRYLLLFHNRKFIYYHKCLKKIQLVDDIPYPPPKKLKHNTEDDFVQSSFCSILKEIKLVKDYLKSHELPVNSKGLLKAIGNEIDEIRNKAFNEETYEEFG